MLFTTSWDDGHPADRRLADLLDRGERFSILPNDQAAVEAFVRARARVTGPTANGAVA